MKNKLNEIWISSSRSQTPSCFCSNDTPDRWLCCEWIFLVFEDVLIALPPRLQETIWQHQVSLDY